MRTTLTLEPDVALKLKRWMKQHQISLKRAVNDALRRGLSSPEMPRKGEFKVEPHPCGFKGGIDLDKLNQLEDELEAESRRHKISK
jgi:hypothetical protein